MVRVKLRGFYRSFASDCEPPHQPTSNHTYSLGQHQSNCTVGVLFRTQPFESMLASSIANGTYRGGTRLRGRAIDAGLFEWNAISTGAWQRRKAGFAIQFGLPVLATAVCLVSSKPLRALWPNFALLWSVSQFEGWFGVWMLLYRKHN